MWTPEQWAYFYDAMEYLKWAGWSVNEGVTGLRGVLVGICAGVWVLCGIQLLRLWVLGKNQRSLV